MKPLYYTLKKNHYSSSYTRAERVSEDDLYAEMGIDYKSLVQSNDQYTNTCAARMSLALLKSGVTIAGRLRIKAGNLAGRSIEPGAKLLADQLAAPARFGKPEIFTSSNVIEKIKNRRGVIFFRKIGGANVDHIDLIETINAIQVCHSNCYFQSTEIWFWELK